jgi:hypothetical protein
MATQQQSSRGAFYTSGAITLARILMFIAFVCLLIAALGAAAVVKSVDWAPWALGGFASWALAGAV